MLVLLSQLLCSAQAPALSFEGANKLYEEGKFAEAAAAYEKLAESGPVSAALYYNSGNAFFKSGQIGRAIAAYHQAEKITPRDPDIRANLQFARNQVQGPTLVPTRSQRWLGRLTLNEWSRLAAGAIWILLLLLALLQWRPALRASLRGVMVIATIAAVILCACLAAAWSESHSTRRVVVTVPDAVVHNGPFDESPTAFRLNDGAEMRVLDEQHEWFQVTADGMRSGWLRKDKVVVEVRSAN
jgi:tetratricopeptide (TPR) repeat protein